MKKIIAILMILSVVLSGMTIVIAEEESMISSWNANRAGAVINFNQPQIQTENIIATIADFSGGEPANATYSWNDLFTVLTLDFEETIQIEVGYNLLVTIEGNLMLDKSFKLRTLFSDDFENYDTGYAKILDSKFNVIQTGTKPIYGSQTFASPWNNGAYGGTDRQGAYLFKEELNNRIKVGGDSLYGNWYFEADSSKRLSMCQLGVADPAYRTTWKNYTVDFDYSVMSESYPTASNVITLRQYKLSGVDLGGISLDNAIPGDTTKYSTVGVEFSNEGTARFKYGSTAFGATYKVFDSVKGATEKNLLTTNVQISISDNTQSLFAGGKYLGGTIAETIFPTGTVAMVANNQSSFVMDNFYVYDVVEVAKMSSTPSSGDKNVKINTPINLNFENSIDATTMNKANVAVFEGSTQIQSYELSLDNNGNTINIAMNEPLKYNKAYSIVVNNNVKFAGDSNKYYYPTVKFHTEPTPFELNSFGIFEGANKIEKVDSLIGNTLDFEAIIKNNSLETPQSFMTTVVLYTPDDMLYDIQGVKTESLSMGEVCELKNTFTLPQDREPGWKIACFVWDSFKNMKQVFRAVIE